MAAVSNIRPLYIEVYPLDTSAEKLETKLEIYFQSAKKSGGGECNVRVYNREWGVYSVQFCSEEVKKRVKAHPGHTIEVGGKNLYIKFITNLPEVDAAETVFTNNAASLSSNILPLHNDSKNKHENIYATGHESGRKKIFLEVSATLNTDLFTKEQRNQVILACPNLKIYRASSHLGIEKVTGHYEDIEKLHCHFEKLLRDHRDSEFLQSKKQDNCVERKEDHNRKYRGDVEELAKMEVPSGIFEYFRQAYKEEIKKKEEMFNVKLVTGNTENGITSIWFSSMGVPNLTKKAQEDFVLLFQKVAGGLKQETVPFIDSYTCEMIKSKCKHIITKECNDTTVLQGPTKEVSDAKALLDGMTAKNWYKKKIDMPPSVIEVDAAVFALLKPVLNPKIELINNKYCTRMEEQHYPDGRLTRIIFISQRYAPIDQSSQASEVFQYEYLMYLDYPLTKGIPLKSLEVLKSKPEDFFAYIECQHPKVKLSLKENCLYITGPPENILFAEMHIMDILNSQEFVPINSEKTAIPDSSVGAATSTSFESQRYHKMQRASSQEPLGGKATEVQPEDCCPICLNTIQKKEVLPKCKHAFCAACIGTAMNYKPVCPLCNVVYGDVKGNQPPGKMDVLKTRSSLPGYNNSGTINITYCIFDGIQTERHPHPGKKFHGTSRYAYLPDNKEGREILKLLERAFDQGLIFTVGQSRTTGANDVVTWNDIHHKTSTHGGEKNFGYPDPNYLKRVREELKAKGIE
ncbi:LOW QUALITY PROTEIN: E3 ubiquitin-protein ligase DTX3L [Erythrolamprus reginae]|uniref:LOW QUALITY PROTEIN: E3 ubiquitin-protein ligase DTX3L n=1 Tax=Erythrolamprus reginae TaxID=121349 RepID=UPI00396C6975